MKYIVTGGCGFIGSNLVKRLSRDGNEVVVIDNLSTGAVSNLPGKFTVLKKISEIKKADDADGIFHLGIPSSTPLYRNDRSLVGKTIAEFIDIMEYAKENKIRIVYASSSSVYNGNKTPYKEDMPILATDFYTEARYAIERLAKVYWDFYKVRSVGLRMFSVYGENEKSKGRYANLVSQIIWAKREGTRFDVYNKGEAVRDFIHVSDVVEAYIKAMNSALNCEILNIGTGKAYTINQIMQAVGLKNYRYVENPLKNYVDKTLADTRKAERLLGFEPKTDLMEYLKRFGSEGA
ncbi:MAG: NAD-dependent epimerase/dehydratase family protein [Candidatus Aenigmarchaeota archaeon]|nr:NAD-dependent epimerase/dehydratase family protein [Candidatus Aenigmarchaeota archaeon]